MSQITGKYQYVSGENFEEFIKKIIGKPELVGILLEAAPAIEFQQNGDQWIVTIGNKDKIVTSTFKLGEPYDEQLPSANLVLKVSYEISSQQFNNEIKTLYGNSSYCNNSQYSSK